MSPRKPAAPTRIQRSGSGHTYFLDGERAKGVTSIIGDGVPKNGLIGWAAQTVADVVVNNLTVATTTDGRKRIVADDLIRELLDWNESRGHHAVKVNRSDPLPRLALAKILANIRYRDSDTASNRGTEVHNIAVKLARGEAVDPPEELRGHVQSYIRFLNEWDPTGVLTERVVVNRRWGYMGKLDFIGDFRQVWPEGYPLAGRPMGKGLLDIKTSRSGVYAESSLQLSGYRNAETMLDGIAEDGSVLEVPMPAVDWTGVIWVRGDGYDLLPVRAEEGDFRAFLYAKHVGEWADWKDGPASTAVMAALSPPAAPRPAGTVS